MNELKSELQTLNLAISNLPRNIGVALEEVFRTLSIRSVLPPIGFVYIQFPGELSPVDLYPDATWINVSSDLAGELIRFEGGGASAFNSGTQINQIEAYNTVNGPNNKTVRKWKRTA